MRCSILQPGSKLSHSGIGRARAGSGCQSNVRPAAIAGPSGAADSVPEAVSYTRNHAVGSRWQAEIAEASVSTPGPSLLGGASSSQIATAAAVGGLILAGLAIKKVYDTPSRAYDQNVGDEYDAWTDEGILEYYWGEHIHLGYYTGMSMAWCPLRVHPQGCFNAFQGQWAWHAAAHAHGGVAAYVALHARPSACAAISMPRPTHPHTRAHLLTHAHLPNNPRRGAGEGVVEGGFQGQQAALHREDV